MATINEAAGESGKAKDAEETDDIVSRFPSPETDERLQTPRGRDLPEPPKVRFTPPVLPQVQVMREDTRGAGGVGGTGLGGGELRGAGLAAGAGIQLFMAIAVCTGLGWAVDRYLLRSVGTPWGLIVGFMVGTASGFMNLFRLTSQLSRGDSGDKEGSGKSSGDGTGR